tara:strand:- start:254 stop:1054 length:801 start_codon:yes stop_codon:yes gene_type:complete
MKELYFDIPLYKTIEINDVEDDKINSLFNFLHFRGLIDGYNPELNENTSFQVEYNRYKDYSSIRDFIGKNERRLKCVRTGYTITAYFLLEEFEDDENEEVNYKFQKIGQYPTIADLEIGKYKKYSKVISKEYLRELNKAIGLSANGVGVGSFVYLRRIFETLIEKYHQKAIKTTEWNEDEYVKSRIAEKIELLKSYLPEAIVKYKKVYSIISKGIHELTEQECLKYFPIVKDAIISMLEQDYLKKENETNQTELENNIKDLVGKLK